MRAIFYDLETSDSEPIGQILNYSFIFVDEHFEQISECSGLVRISRLQLPSPGAILANKTDVVSHQKRAADSELVALGRIHEFISKCLAEAQVPVALVGFNSSKFDLAFLRTSWIRNGFDPFVWRERLVERDVFIAVKKLICSNPDFPFPVAQDASGKRKRTLRLEALAHEFGLLQGAQAHEAREDVLLTIRLAQCLRERFRFNCVSYDPYEARSFERLARKAEVVCALEPNYEDVDGPRAVAVPFTLLDVSATYALWVNLSRYEKGKGRAAVSAMKKSGTHFFVAPHQSCDEAAIAKATLAQEEYKALNLGNFWSKVFCDVELHIFDLDFDDRRALAEALKSGDPAALSKRSNKNALVLFIRHQLANYEYGSGDDALIDGRLKKYALRRYGGQVVVSKHEPSSEAPARYYPTLKQYLAEIEKLIPECSPLDKALLESLRTFYFASDIFRVAGAELLAEDFKSAAATADNIESARIT